MNKIYTLPLGLLIAMQIFSMKNFAQTSNLPGTALSFAAAGQYVTGTGINTGIAAITLEAWIYHNSLPNQIERYISIGPEIAVIRHDGSIYGGAGQLHFYIKKSNGSMVGLRVNGALSTGVWTHVAGTYDGTNLKLYLNGALIASSAPSAVLFSPSGNFDFSDNTEFLDGKLDELRVWNYARSEQQIRENMHLTLSGSETGLLNYWQLNEGSGTTAHDYTGNCNGTLTGLGSGNWVNSTIPLGGGNSNSQTVTSTGNAIFTGTGFSSNFTALSGTDNITVSRINLSPNTKPSDPFYAACSQYWVVKNFDNKIFTTDLTFTLTDDFNSYNGLNPGSVKLFARSANSDGDWSLVKKAASVDTVANTATFSGVNAFGQFLVLRSYPENYSGNALEFDGADDYIQLSEVSGFQYSNSFTVEAWVKPEVMGNGFHSIAAKGTEWELKMYDGPSFIIIEFGVNNNVNFSRINLNPALVVGKWLHLCGVVNQAEGQKSLILYVNGEAGSSAIPPGLSPSASPIIIGSGFKGKIDEVQIWREARTQQQIREKMHLTPTNTDKNMVVCLQFNEPYGITANDVAGGNDGTLTNMISGCWVLSGAPVGGGVSNTQAEASGNVNFTGTGLSMFFNSHASASITVSRIDAAPNINTSLFDSQYWIINRFGTGTFDANLTFTVSEDLTANDQTSSSRIKLYSRPTNDDNNWIYTQNAVSVDASGNSAIFNNLTGFSQLAVCRRLPADNFAGNALSFHHASDYISGTGLKSSMLQFTIEAWVYHTNLSAEVQQYITLGPNAAGIKYNGQSGGGDTWLNFYITTNNYSGYAVTADNVLSTNKWMHVAGSYDGTTMKLYLNGELVQTMAASATLNTPDGTFTISGSDAMDGKMDEIRIWNYARDIADIRADMYRTLSGTESGLVSYWQFNEGNGTVVTDIVGGNAGAFHNMDPSPWTASTAPMPFQSIASGNWGTTSTWAMGQDVPVKDWSRVQVYNAVVIDSDKTMTDLTIDAAASLVVAPTSHLSVTGNLLNNAGNTGLQLQSDDLATASLINNTANLDATVERYIPKYVGNAGWHFLSSPVAAQNIRPGFVNNGTPSVDNDFYKFSEPDYLWINTKLESGEWNPAFEDAFVLGKGYLVAYKTDITKSFVGKLNAGNFTFNGTSNPALTYSATGEGWNLLGNPFPSALDWDDFTKTNINGSAYVYDGAAGQYISWNGTTGSLANGIIPPMNGFFVKTATGASLTIPFSSRKHTSINFYKDKTFVENLLVLEVAGNGFSDKTYIHFREDATAGLDNEFDAFKLFGIGEAPQLYTSVDEEMLSINSLPFMDDEIAIPLNLKVGKEDKYEISVDENTLLETVGMSLKDLTTGIVYDLHNQTSINVNHSPVNPCERFLLLLNRTTSANEILDETDGIEIYSNNQHIFIKSKKQESTQVSVYTMLGQTLLSKTFTGLGNGQAFQIDFTGKTGFYLVKVKTNNGTKSEKIYIK
ncbi:MAG: LamG-like jellyroll fold domain-containing protein [Bacteroidota bacterium]